MVADAAVKTFSVLHEVEQTFREFVESPALPAPQ
jgi:hypothetical protein